MPNESLTPPRAFPRHAGTLLAMLFLLLSGCGWNPFAGATFSAVIRDQAGQPLPGAVASSEGRGAIADAEGRVQLSDVRGRVSVQKTGYGRLEVDPQTGAVTLAKRQAPLSIAWDERYSAPVAMEGIKGHLVNRGFKVATLKSGPLPEAADVVVLACPSWFDESAYSQYMRAAYAGTKLVLLGEWGGFDGVDLAALTSLSSKAGISFDSAQVRVYGSGGQAQSWISVKGVAPSTLASGISSGVTVFTSGALKVEAPAQAVLTSEPSAIRILRWDVGVQTLAALGPLGSSQVVAIADSSLFSDENGPEGNPQWKASDNPRFAENVMAW